MMRIVLRWFVSSSKFNKKWLHKSVAIDWYDPRDGGNKENFGMKIMINLSPHHEARKLEARWRKCANIKSVQSNIYLQSTSWWHRKSSRRTYLLIHYQSQQRLSCWKWSRERWCKLRLALCWRPGCEIFPLSCWSILVWEWDEKQVSRHNCVSMVAQKSGFSFNFTAPSSLWKIFHFPSSFRSQS